MSLKESSRQLPNDIYANNPVAIIGQMAMLLTEEIITEQTCTSCNILGNKPCQSDILEGCYLAEFPTLDIRISTRGD